MRYIYIYIYEPVSAFVYVFLKLQSISIIYYEVMGFRIIQVVTFLNMVFLTSCKHVLTSTLLERVRQIARTKY